MTTDISERGLEDIIVAAMVGTTPIQDEDRADAGEAGTRYAGTGWVPGRPQDYDREYAVDLEQLRTFLQDTQPKIAAAVDLDNVSPTRQKFTLSAGNPRRRCRPWSKSAIITPVGAVPKWFKGRVCKTRIHGFESHPHLKFSARFSANFSAECNCFLDRPSLRSPFLVYRLRHKML